MSNAESYEAVTVSSDGVTVVKRFEADEFPVPAIAFNIQSARTEPVTVTLTDDVPSDVAVEDLGFHPEYGSEHWTIDEDTITFEREIDADSEYTTVYGIRATGTDDVEKFLTEPSIESVDPPMEDEEDLVDDAGSDVVRDVIAGDSDSVPGLDETDDEEIETLDLADPNAAEEGTTAENGENGTIEGVQPGSVAKTLAAEIRQDAVDDATLAVLEEELDLGSAGSDADTGAVDARIQHLQNEVSDLSAYTTALEEFLDENGQGEEMIQDFRERLEQFEGELSSVANGLESVESEIGSVGETVSDHEDTVSAHEETMSQLEDAIDDVEGDVEDLEAQIGDATEVNDRLEAIEEDIEDLEEWREQLSSVIGGGE